jgi:PST family polysaccharide transporter
MWRELARYGRHVIASEFLTEVTAIGSTALIGRALGPAPLGIYRAASRLANQIANPIIAASNTVLLPAFARIADDVARLRRAALRSIRLQCVVVLPLSLAFIPLGEAIVVALLGEQWRAAGHVLAALCGLTASLPLIRIASEVFKGVGRPSFLSRQSALWAVTALAGIAAFLPLGAVGVGAGVSISALIVALFSGWALADLLEVRLTAILMELAPPLVAAAGMVGILLALDRVIGPGETTVERLAVLGLDTLIGTAAYVALLAALKPSLIREFVDLRRLRRRVPPGLPQLADRRTDG